VKYRRVVDSHRAYLGILPGETNGGGVYVGQIVKGSPAAKAGLHVGDVIVSIDKKPTPTAADLLAVLATLKPRTRVPVVVRRQNDQKQTIDVTLGELPGK
jgi:S1-C subfamily serine protease